MTQNRGSSGETCGNGRLSTQGDFVEVSSHVRLHVRDWGQGKSFVFVHGWPLSNEMFEYQLTQLAQGGFRCVAPSLRGFGKSNQPWEGYNLDILADDLRAILEARCLQDVVLVGFGMGGTVMLRYMTRHAGYRVSKLAFLAAAAPVWTRRGDFPEGGPDRSEVERLVAHCWADRARLVAKTIARFFRTDRTSSPPWRTGSSNWACRPPRATAALLRMLGQTDLRADMAAVRVATLVLHGSHDKIAPFGVGEALARGIQRSHLVPFDESGHALFWEERERLNAELARFAV